MKAVIMAGGEGTRLRPLTSLLPKPMVPIVNQPVMEHIVGLVKHHGITEIVATLAFMPQVIADYFGGGEEWGVALEYAIEESPLGTAGSVKNAQALLADDEPFLVISGDALTDIDLGEVIDFHKRMGGAVTIALKSMPDPLDFGVVITAADGLIERFLEKPTWGQVFSDRINTGIYVVEPWVLNEIPQDTPYDFSADLFPKLMEQGHKLYGITVDGYWCDVGGRETYVQAHRDILSGMARVYVPGISAREGLWIADSALVDPTAKIGERVVIGKNTKIRADAVVGDYAVIGDNCIVGSEARVSDSIVWDDTFIGKHTEVSGAILCRHVDVRAQSIVEPGVCIGSESVIGLGAHIGGNVQIFPYKRVEPSAMVTSSLIWESTGPRSLFGDASILGLIGIDITPELGLRVAEAFGSLLPKGGHVVVTRDTSKAARMVKRAIAAGLNAAGINVRDLRVASPALSRFTTQKTRCVGGIHICSVPDDPQSLEIRFFDRNGLDITPWEQKKIERLYFRAEFRRAFFEDVGEILYPPRPLEYYTVALNEAIAQIGNDGGWRHVVTDMGGGTASLVLPSVAADWHIKLIALNPVVDFEASSAFAESQPEAVSQLKHALELFGADLGVAFDKGAERVMLMMKSGAMLDGDTALHLMVDLWCRTRGDVDGAIAVPLTASLTVETIAARYGRHVVRPGRSRRALAQAVLDRRAVFAGGATGGYIFGDFFPAYDGVLTLGMVTRMLASSGRTIDELVAELPSFHKTHLKVFCPTERKGAVMRAIIDEAATMASDLTEGVRVSYDDGWALVLPDSVDPEVGVWAEASDADSALQRAGYWRDVVTRATRQQG
ncbi:MAG: mannose-1-phosphate guanyltransferase [Actinobacteria bacterium HGW-Actinobacteria-7]|nr:MAG: mannose-1-phosphate guanyltransferase [Actinobacteria bacterium HGW-Actinobacteria-7]